MLGPAVLLVALSVTAGSTAGPAVVAALAAAAAIGGPLLGALLDRSAAPGRLLAVALVGVAGGVAAIGLLLGRVSLPGVLIIGVLVGLLRPAVSGGWSSRLGSLVDERVLPRAAAWDGVTFDLAAFGGPVLVGLLVLIFDPLAGLAAAVVLTLAAIPPALALNHTLQHPRPRPRTALSAGLLSAGRAILLIRSLRRATSVSVISYIGIGIFTTSLPLLSRAALGTERYAPLLVAAAAGAGLAANLMISIRRFEPVAERLLLASVAGLSVSIALAAVSALAGTGPAIVMVITAILITGAADGPQLVALLRIRHQASPPGLRGQIFTTAASLKITGYAIGAGATGPLAERSLPLALLVASGCQLLAVGCHLLDREW